MSVKIGDTYSFPNIDALLKNLDNTGKNDKVAEQENEPEAEVEEAAASKESEEPKPGTIFSKIAFEKDQNIYEIGILPFKNLEMAIFYGSKSYVSTEEEPESEEEAPEEETERSAAQAAPEDETTYREVNVHNNYGGIVINQRLGGGTVYLEATQGKDSLDGKTKEKKITFSLPDDKFVLRAEEYKYSNAD